MEETENMVKEENKDNVIYIGKKNVHSYVLATVTQFGSPEIKNVRIKARGKLISRAVDVAEIVRNRFLPEIKLEEIKIGTEELPSNEGGTSKVSFIEILLAK